MDTRFGSMNFSICRKDLFNTYVNCTLEIPLLRAAGSPVLVPPSPAIAGRIRAGAFWFGPVVRPVGCGRVYLCTALSGIRLMPLINQLTVCISFIILHP